MRFREKIEKIINRVYSAGYYDKSVTEYYICRVEATKAILDAVKEIVPHLGVKMIRKLKCFFGFHWRLRCVSYFDAPVKPDDKFICGWCKKELS